MEVQRQVADLLRDKVLVGHAVFNDLKACPFITNPFLWYLTVSLVQALLLSHPFPSTRDTQLFAYKYELSKSRRPALRSLTVQEFGIQIQGGEHSSVRSVFLVHHAARIYVYNADHRRQSHNGDIPPPPSPVGKREETLVIAVRGPRSLGSLPNIEEAETLGQRREQRSSRRREEGYMLRTHNNCQKFGPLKNKKKYVIAGIQEKDRLVVRTGVIERFTTDIIEFLDYIQMPSPH